MRKDVAWVGYMVCNCKKPQLAIHARIQAKEKKKKPKGTIIQILTRTHYICPFNQTIHLISVFFLCMDSTILFPINPQTETAQTALDPNQHTKYVITA